MNPFLQRQYFLDDKAYAEKMDREVRAAYPAYADDARRFMNSVLRRADRQMLLVFNGEAADKNMDLGELATTHRYISSLLECRAKGQPVTDWYLELVMRGCLGLGYAVIQGGKTN